MDQPFYNTSHQNINPQFAQVPQITKPAPVAVYTAGIGREFSDLWQRSRRLQTLNNPPLNLNALVIDLSEAGGRYSSGHGPGQGLGIISPACSRLPEQTTHDTLRDKAVLRPIIMVEDLSIASSLRACKRPDTFDVLVWPYGEKHATSTQQ